PFANQIPGACRRSAKHINHECYNSRMFPSTGARTALLRSNSSNRAGLLLFALLLTAACLPAAAQSPAPSPQNLIREARAAAAKNQWDEAARDYQQAIQ